MNFANKKMARAMTLTAAVALCAQVAMAQLPSGTAPTTLFQLNGLVGRPGQPGLDGIADGSSPTAGNTFCTYRDPATGNPVPNQTCDNWNDLNGPPRTLGHADETAFVNGSSENFLFKQGTKDTQDVSAWNFSPDQKAPPKDTFNFAYSAGYTAPTTNDFVLVFGGDRAAPNGDANIGMWLLQATVVPCVAGGISAISNTIDPNCNGIAAGSFSGKHFDHDIFVTSAFTNGGTAPFLNIYDWDSACSSLKNPAKNPKIGDCADTNLRLLGTASTPTSLCGDTNSGCGIVNSVTTHSTWEGAIASPLYFGGGIDVSAALAIAGVGHAPCFASFELETRSSQSSGAELKDFVVGGFPECAITVTKACVPPPSVNFIGSTAYVHYVFSGVVKNVGGGALFNLKVADTFPANAVNGAVTQPGTPVGGLAQGQSASYSGSFDFPNLSKVTNHITASAAVSDGGPNTITADKNGNPAAADADFGTPGSTCSLTVHPSLTLTKTCSVGLNPTQNGVVLALNDNITVCNNSSDTSIGNITLTNNVLLNGPSSGVDKPVDSGLTLKAGDCKTYTPSYIPTQCDAGAATLDGGRCEFTDTVRIDTVQSTPKDEFGNPVPVNNIDGPKQASCHVCPFGACTLSGRP